MTMSKASTLVAKTVSGYFWHIFPNKSEKLFIDFSVTLSQTEILTWQMNIHSSAVQKKQNLRGLYHSYALAHPLPSDTQFKERKRKKNPKKFPEEGKKRNQRRSQMCTSCCMCNIDRSNSCIRTQVQKKVYHMKIWGSDSDCFNWKLRKQVELY